MADFANREHYIPIRKGELVELLCKDLIDSDKEKFRQFCTILSATFHFEYHQQLETLKMDYAPFDPDSVTESLQTLSAEEKEERKDKLFEQFVWLMERANFKNLSREELEKAMEEVSDWGINMTVDFDIFDRLEVFVRGDSIGKRSRRKWYRFFRLETIEVAVFKRLALILKLRQHKSLGKNLDTNAVFLKLFKDIPKADIEMLLPGARLQMPGLTRIKLGGSFFGGLGYIIFQVSAQILKGLTLGLAALWAPLAALFGYAYKQWYGYNVTKQQYTLQLTQSLYYQNLDNNAGVLNHLLDEAEEQECREAILGYYYLWRQPKSEGWTADQLDDHVENELERMAEVQVDFEIEDALGKLERLELIAKQGDGYAAKPIDQALERLDHAWDNYFQYNQSELRIASAE